MTAPTPQRKKLIEVALPLEEINKASIREKSIRHGHPSTLHLWWARRPLATCRAVLFASLVDDPSSLPEWFPTEAAQEAERKRLFEIIKQLVVWENSNNSGVLLMAQREIARSAARAHGVELPSDCDEAQVAEALRRYAPPVLDPFAGGGSIPLEAQRLGLQAHASDLNPVAVLINKALIEIPPRFASQPPVNPERRGEHQNGAWRGASGLADDVRYYGKWMRDEAFKRIGHLYPTVTLPREYGGGEAMVIAWLWARTVRCPNPACGAQMPLVRSFAVSTKEHREVFVQPEIDRDMMPPTIRFTVREGQGAPEGTVNRKGARCIACGMAVQFPYIRDEGKAGRMGAQMMAIVAEGQRGRVYLAPNEEHAKIAQVAAPDNVPDSDLPKQALGFRVQLYGMTKHRDLFTPRQLVALTTFSDLVSEARAQVLADGGDAARADAVATYLAFAVDRLAESLCSLARWQGTGDKVAGAYARQALPMIWDYAEVNPFSGSTRNFGDAVEWVAECFDKLSPLPMQEGFVRQCNAIAQNGYVHDALISTDPPYFDNIGYSDLSDFFYVWMRRSIGDLYPSLFKTLLTPKKEELVATPYRFGGSKKEAEKFFLEGLNFAFTHLRSIQNLDFPMTVYYAYKQSENDADNAEQSSSTGATASTGWETMLEGLIKSGFTITGTWPMRTERSGRTLSIGTNALASSIVLACRPRPAEARMATRRDFLDALRRELGAALRTMQRDTIAPVDLAQAAIGPGMAVYSRFSKVVESDGTRLTVRTALQLINSELDALLSEQEGDYDPLTRFCVAWYEQFGFDTRHYGDAENMAHAKNIAIATLTDTGVFEAKNGKAKLVARDALPQNWSPKGQPHVIAWALLQHLVRAHQQGGNEAAAALLRYAPALSDTVRNLSYRLFVICDRKKWSSEAFVYNSLVNSWNDILALISKSGYAAEQQTLLMD